MIPYVSLGMSLLVVFCRSGNAAAGERLWRQAVAC